MGLQRGDGSRLRLVVRRPALERGVRSRMVKVIHEIEKFAFEIRRGPEAGAIQEFTSDRAVMLPSQLCGVPTQSF